METRVSSGWMGCLTQVQTFLFFIPFNPCKAVNRVSRQILLGVPQPSWPSHHLESHKPYGRQAGLLGACLKAYTTFVQGCC